MTIPVYFQKTPHGDYVCYDELNTTGDLFVDPAKINLLTDLLESPVQLDGYAIYSVRQNIEVKGFGTTNALIEVYINDDGHIRYVDVLFDENDVGTKFESGFVLQLEKLPEFEVYQYEDEPPYNGNEDNFTNQVE